MLVVSFLSDFGLSMGDGIVTDFYNNLTYFLGFRFIFLPWVTLLRRWFIGRHHVVLASLRLSVIVWLSFVFWFWFSAYHSMVYFAFFKFSPLGLVTMVLAAPIWFATGFVLLASFIDACLFLVSGNIQYMIRANNSLARIVRTFWIPFYSLTGFFQYFSLFPGRGLLFLSEVAIKMPSEIFDMICKDGLALYLKNTAYVGVRFILFFWAFNFIMLGWWSLLVIPFAIFLVLLAFGCLFLWYTRSCGSLSVALISGVYFFFRGFLPEFVIHKTDRFYRVCLESIVKVRASVSLHIQKTPLCVRLPDSTLKFIRPETPLSDVPLPLLSSLVGHEHIRFMRVSAPLLAFYLITYYFVYIPIRSTIIRGSAIILNFPFKVLNALFFSSLVFFIPGVYFDICISTVFNIIVSTRWLWEKTGVFLDKSCKMAGLAWIYGSSYAASLHYIGKVPEHNRLSQVFVRSFVSMTRVSILRFVEYMDNVRLPELLQAQYQPPTIDSIRSTLIFLKGISFPIDQSAIDSLSSDNTSPYLAEWGSFKNRIMGRLGIEGGFRKALRTGVSFWLPDDFFPEVPGYIHAATFTGVAEEILATSRYWNDKEGESQYTIPGFDQAIEDLWEVVSPQYANSKLATFQDIYRLWVKKYNMGFGFVSKKGKHFKNLTRQAVIDSMGGKKPFLDAWGKVFYNGLKLILPSPVFTKYETLKLKKALARSPRTVIGASFVEYVLASVFAYKPNHNYQYWSTPMKVGMPITGRSFNTLWESLLGHEQVRAGDCTAFDSSQRPFMVKIVAEIRKKGYTMHKDYHKICMIIDHVYQGLIDQPMAFRSFGDIASKGKGFSTGHTSTTPDNSLSLVCNYLMAWRIITGLRAREFMNFNTLANFGDDHVIAFDPVFGWSPEAAWKVMGTWGTIVRDEAPGETRMPKHTDPMPAGGWASLAFSFLSKKPLPMVPAVRAELERAGVKTNMTYATLHDKSRLLGKIKAHNLVRSFNSKLRTSKGPDHLNEKMREYTRALSYLSLCAHHKDIYDSLIYNIHEMWVDNKEVWAKNGFAKSCRKPPSYNQVLRDWYKEGLVLENPNKFVLDGDLSDQEESEKYIMMIENPDPFGVFIRWLSDAPTLFSPRYRNTRWADWLQAKLARELSWPLEFVAKANGVRSPGTVISIVAKTPYSFLRNQCLSGAGSTPFGVLLFRNWLFMAYQRFVVPRRYGFSFLDLIRILDHGFVTGVFMATGRVTQVLVELDLHIFDSFMVYLLSFVNIDIPIPPVSVVLPPPSDLLGQFISWALRIIQPSGSIDFQSLDARLNLMKFDLSSRFRFSAPTGTGKSTRMVQRIQVALSKPVVVIVPRREVALSLAHYMDTLYPHSGVVSSTEGGTYVPGSRIIYTTVQSFFLRDELQHPENIIFFDECHVYEPHYLVMHNWLKQNQIRTIYCTATPPPSISEVDDVVVPAVSSFNVAQAEHEFDSIKDYLTFVSDFINGRSTWERSIVFVPTLKNAYVLQDMLRSSSAIVSSKDRGNTQDVSTYVCTSVADVGLTIPDVVFVFSPNFDVTVTNNGSKHNPKKPYFYPITELTKVQRKGRTGRTSDGTFVFCTIKDIPTAKVSYTVWDYVESLGLAAGKSFPFFPKDVKTSGPVILGDVVTALDRVDLVMPSLPLIVEKLRRITTGKTGAQLTAMIQKYVDERYNNLKTAYGDARRGPLEPLPTDPDITPFDTFNEYAAAEALSD